MSEPAFHVFLCHNSLDKPAVEEIARALREGLRPWLDVWEPRPGVPWQPALDARDQLPELLGGVLPLHLAQDRCAAALHRKVQVAPDGAAGGDFIEGTLPQDGDYLVVIFALAGPDLSIEIF